MSQNTKTRTARSRSSSSQGGMYLPRLESNVNMSMNERMLYLLLGVLLMAFGALRRGFAVFAIPAGLIVAAKGATGNNPMLRAAGKNHAVKTNPEAVSVPHEQGVHMTHTITIHRPAVDIYTELKNPETIERIVPQLDSVVVSDAKHGRWTIKLPGGVPVSTEIEIVNDVHGEVIGWRSIGNSPVSHAGAIRFLNAPNGGTKIRLQAEYVPPAGVVGMGAAKLLGVDPDELMVKALRNLKQWMENGEIQTESDATENKRSKDKA